MTVRTIFREFLRLGNVTTLRDWMRENNVVSRSGHYFYRVPLYALLRNPHYIGLIKQKKERYPGEHPAIIDRETWDKSQVLLDDNRQGGRRKPRTTKTSVFASLIFDAEGTFYTPTHASKNGRRYRYYTSQAVIQKRLPHAVPRIPAPDLETAVTDRILLLLRNPEGLLAALRNDTQESPNIPAGFYTRAISGAAFINASWQSRTPADRELFLRQIIDRVIVHPTQVEIRIKVPQLFQQLTGSAASSTIDTPDTKSQTTPLNLPPIATIDCPFHHIPQGRALRLIVGNNQITTDASRQAIPKAIARARRWYEQIISNEVVSLPEIARRQKINYAYVKKIFPLALLRPSRIEQILSGQDSAPSLNALLADIPTQWADTHLPRV